MTSATVTIVQRRLTHYRVPLFEAMREQLSKDGVRLRLLHGDATVAERQKRDEGCIEWAEHLTTRYFLDDRVCWQPFMRQAAGSDVIVVTQENKLINNLLALTTPKRPAVAFWGHGRNMQARRDDSPAERFKRWTTRRVDWWFAYTELSARFVREDGFPSERITVLQNSIDTGTLRANLELARQRPRSSLRQGFGLGAGPVAVFVGSLYEEKRLPFLIEAARRLQSEMPDFELVVAGQGPQQQWIEAQAEQFHFIKYVGSVHGTRKAELLASADIMLNPGLVGLGILDAFVAGLPLMTTDCHLHSPEIAYLADGQNGCMTPDSIDHYVEATLALLRNGAELARLQAGAAASGEHYSIEHMTQRFCAGLLRCLSVVRPMGSAL